MKSWALGVASLFALAVAAGEVQAGEGGKGFYLQGSLGGAFSRDTEMKWVDGANSTINSSAFPLKGDVGNSLSFGLGLGYTFNPAVRADFTVNHMPGFRSKFTHQDNSTSSGLTTTEGDVSSTTFLVTGYLHPLDLTPVSGGAPRKYSPYFLVGFGMAYNDGDELVTTPRGQYAGTGPFKSPGASSADFAWQIGGGIDAPVGEGMRMFAQYAYMDLGALDYNSGLMLNQGAGTYRDFGALKGAELSTHALSVGLRYNF